MILRELTQADPMRAYGVTHRAYKGSFDDELALHGTYGRLIDGSYVPDQNLLPWNRRLTPAELGEMLIWGGVTPERITAAQAAGDVGDLIISNLMLLGPFLDHDDRWTATPSGDHA
jgi:hypothetical protein